MGTAWLADRLSVCERLVTVGDCHYGGGMVIVHILVLSRLCCVFVDFWWTSGGFHGEEASLRNRMVLL